MMIGGGVGEVIGLQSGMSRTAGTTTDQEGEEGSGAARERGHADTWTLCLALEAMKSKLV